MTRTHHYIGKSLYDRENFHGAMRFVAVYDRALTAADHPCFATTAFGIGLAGATTLAACEPAEEATCSAGTYRPKSRKSL